MQHLRDNIWQKRPKREISPSIKTSLGEVLTWHSSVPCCPPWPLKGQSKERPTCLLQRQAIDPPPCFGFSLGCYQICIGMRLISYSRVWRPSFLTIRFRYSSAFFIVVAISSKLSLKHMSLFKRLVFQPLHIYSAMSFSIVPWYDRVLTLNMFWLELSVKWWTTNPCWVWIFWKHRSLVTPLVVFSRFHPSFR